jgi:DNA invertase Pin-like site-specific DNA recombinase
VNNTAISYLRFSSSKQKKGASYDRQLEATEIYCAQNNLILIDKIEDKGISGWNEDNLEETAALGKLIKLIQLGKIKKGTTLIVENLDRITRANLTKAVNLITTILLSGVDIVTTMDGKRYCQGSDQADIMFAIFYLTRGNEESETKSKRVKQAWVKKRQMINEGKFVKLTQHPNWLKIENYQYVENEDATKLVRRIFEMYTSGIGGNSIANQLNKEQAKPFSRTGKKFTFSSIERLLKNPAVIGRCEVVSPPKENYYPKIISESTWYQAQSMREKNNHYKGTRNDSDKINFLGGLVFCKECSNSLVRYSCGIKNQRYHYLVCSSAKYGSHKMVLFNYQKIQETFIMAIFKCNFFNDFLDSKRHAIDNKNIEALNGKLIEIQSRINNVCDAIEETKSKDLKLRLNDLQLKKSEIETEIIAQNKLSSDQHFNFSTQELFLKTVLQDIDDNVFRIRLRRFLRSIIESIVIWKDDDLKGIVAYVRFKDSSDKITIMFKDKGNFSAVILLNNKTVSFSNSKSAAWFDDQGNPQDIDPFFLKEHVGRDENNKPKEIAKIDTAKILLKQN